MPAFSWARTSSLAALLTVAGCAPMLAPVSSADVARATARWPGITLGELEHGRALYAVKCTSCHELMSPHRHRPDEWPDEVHRMLRSAHLTPAEGDLITRYLVTASGSPPVR